MFAAQGIRHITHDRDSGFPDAGVQSGNIDGADLLQVLAAAFQFTAFAVQKPHAQCPGTAHAAVIGGASADGDGNICEALIQRVTDHFAGSITGGEQRIPFLNRNQRQSGSRSHFDDSTALIQLAVAGSDLFHHRAADFDGDPLTVFRRNNCICGSLTAICNRYAAVLDVAENLCCRFSQQLNCLFTGQCALERIRCKQKLHDGIPPELN